MKARIKETGEIVEVYPDTLAGFLADDGCYYKNEELSTELDHWSSFRREAAKDIVCALLQDNRTSYSQPYEWFCKQAIDLTDELIKQLKEK